MMPRVAVVGGCGFIGSRLARALARSGIAVTVIDLAPRPTDLDGLCRVEARDVTVSGSLGGAFAVADVVFLAAAKLAKQCADDPAQGWGVNVDGTANALLEILREGRRPRVVFLSSGAVYAHPADHYPIAEDAATVPAGLYGVSKLAGEQLVAAAAAKGGFAAVVLRLFTVYGPGPASAERGHFVAGWIEKAAAGQPIPVHGDGRRTVDLTHVNDAVRACRLATKASLQPDRCHVFNIGSGSETRTGDVARWMGDVLPSLEVASAAAPDDVARRQVADLRRAAAELGYAPRVRPEAGIKTLLRERLRAGRPSCPPPSPCR